MSSLNIRFGAIQFFDVSTQIYNLTSVDRDVNMIFRNPLTSNKQYETLSSNLISWKIDGITMNPNVLSDINYVRYLIDCINLKDVMLYNLIKNIYNPALGNQTIKYYFTKNYGFQWVPTVSANSYNLSNMLVGDFAQSNFKVDYIETTASTEQAKYLLIVGAPMNMNNLVFDHDEWVTGLILKKASPNSINLLTPVTIIRLCIMFDQWEAFTTF